ncbi:hypothetical protein FRX31_009147 [Thalictrum thalictroides]|uniref:Tetratricopeptide repeat protein n=1 Tax=Thalictrum thalictroides TaxID=46969 RepID=A0A7J6WV18_THATH|nr:hypothetical protein FRX31_009147 [Thalictrum thalictroides]
MDKKKAKAYYLRGKAQQMLGNHREASEDFERAFRLHDSLGESRCLPQENVDAYVLRAIAQDMLGNHKEARKDRDQTTKQPGNHFSFRYNREWN